MTTKDAIEKRVEQMKTAIVAGQNQLKKLQQESLAMQRQVLVFKGGLTELETLLQGINSEEVSDSTD
jgi:hypothetical protein